MEHKTNSTGADDTMPSWARERLSFNQKLRLYLELESTSLARYIVERVVFSLFSWVPGLIGVALRAVAYRLVLDGHGVFIVRSGAILKRPAAITLGAGCYIDHGVSILAAPNGVSIGRRTRIMTNAVLDVHNFREFDTAGIVVGDNTLIGPFNYIMGQGGVKIGDNVLFGPRVSVLPVNHHYEATDRPIRDQGITAKGIRIDDDSWIGAHAVILDGVHIGRGSVVAAGAVVADDVPPYSMAVGSPARVVKSWSPEA